MSFSLFRGAGYDSMVRTTCVIGKPERGESGPAASG
jgi:hypothetical protein